MGCANRQCRLAVDRARQNFRADRLRHAVRLSGEIRFIHRTVTVHNDSIHGTDFMRQHDQHVFGCNRLQGDVGHRRVDFSMGPGRHAFGQRVEHRRSTSHGVRFERLSAGQHEHDQHAGQILSQDHRGNDRDSRKHVRPELRAHELRGQVQHQRRPPEDQTHHQRQPRKPCDFLRGHAQTEMHDHRQNRDGGNDRIAQRPDPNEPGSCRLCGLHVVVSWHA